MPIKCEVEETETDTFVVLDDFAAHNHSIRPLELRRQKPAVQETALVA